MVSSSSRYQPTGLNDAVVILTAALVAAVKTRIFDTDKGTVSYQVQRIAPTLLTCLLSAIACTDAPAETTKSPECENIGLMETAAEITPAHADTLSELHLTFDTQNRLHYCYFGYNGDKAVSYYGRDTGNYKFTEEEVRVDDAPVVCAGIEVAKNGTPYLLSKQPAAAVLKTDGTWKSFALKGLESSSAASALRGEDTVVTLSRAGKDGVYATLSMGFQTANQPMYGAEINKDKLTVLFNGHLEDENPSIVGYGPQILEQGKNARLIAGRIFQFSVVLADVSLDILSETEGLYPKAAVSEQGDGRTLYLNHNDRLILSEIDEAALSTIADLGNVYPQNRAPGHLPWELAVDTDGTTHVLFEDNAQGENALLYQMVKEDGELGAPRILTENLVDTLPGNGLYKITVDTCGRPMAAIIENPADRGDSPAMPSIRILQGR